MIRRRVKGDFAEEQQGFRKGRVTADWMYVLIHMVQKRKDVQGSMVLGIVDLENVFDTVPREICDGDATVDGSTRSGSEDG